MRSLIIIALVLALNIPVFPVSAGNLLGVGGALQRNRTIDRKMALEERRLELQRQEQQERLELQRQRVEAQEQGQKNNLKVLAIQLCSKAHDVASDEFFKCVEKLTAE